MPLIGFDSMLPSGEQDKNLSGEEQQMEIPPFGHQDKDEEEAWKEREEGDNCRDEGGACALFPVERNDEEVEVVEVEVEEEEEEEEEEEVEEEEEE